MRLKAKDFKEVFQEQLSPWLKRKIMAYNFVYRPLSNREKEEYRLKVIKKNHCRRPAVGGSGKNQAVGKRLAGKFG